ncbi:hypothetical protein [Verrucomicrobium sp. 3C]|uniref:hypothetical protein n=1 Tax=Verrucomicrobium sp. 3C TaxID=1134055 RepID=UPI000372A28B|nr:hypothetical protein [Verrucomicrobium sp. 3C]
MTRPRSPVLLDTNVILECFRVGSWRALSSGYGLRTVEACFTETQAGFPRRRPELRIDPVYLKNTLRAVHAVMGRELAAVAVRAPDILLDEGERVLWAHALTRSDAWVFCGPDKASLRMGIRLGFKDRRIALETLLDAVGHRPNEALRKAYTASWLKQALAELRIAEGLDRL